MKCSQAGIDLIKRFEGFSAECYVCPAGKRTIGYGHVLAEGEAEQISAQEAEALLVKDIASAEEAVNRLVEVPLSQHQFDALVCLTYNIGNRAFSRSTLLRLLNNGDYMAAAAQFPRWVYASGKLLNGLRNRREAEQQLFLNNI